MTLLVVVLPLKVVLAKDEVLEGTDLRTDDEAIGGNRIAVTAAFIGLGVATIAIILWVLEISGPVTIGVTAVAVILILVTAIFARRTRTRRR